MGTGVAASGKPAAAAAGLERIEAIEAGAPAAGVVPALGEPPGKVATGKVAAGEGATGERAGTWTYVLASGSFAKVKLESGRVAAVVLPD